MVQKTAIEEFTFLVQTQDKGLEKLLSDTLQDNNIQLIFVEDSAHLHELKNSSQVIAFIIGSDVPDPIQSAQRLHGLNKNAKVVLLGKTGELSNLKNTIRFAPFVGSDVTCIDISDDKLLKEKLLEIEEMSSLAEKYRAIIAESNIRISENEPVQDSPFSQSFINKLLDIAPIGIAVVDRHGVIYGWNREAALIFERSEAQVLGKTLSENLNDGEVLKFKRFLRENVEDQKIQHKDPLVLERKLDSDAKQVLSITAAPFSHMIGKESAFILVIQDITQQKKAEEDLQKMNATLEDKVVKRTASLLAYQAQLRSLASQLSKAEEKERQNLAAELHDHLGQMLAVLKMKVALLQRNTLSEAVAKDVDDIKTGVEDALIYTRDLMSDLKPPPTLEKENMRESMKWLAKKMKKHNLKVEVEDDDQPKPVSDEIQTLLIQCVRELLFNIVKHAEVEKARIILKKSDSHASISVIDKGKGFDPVKQRNDADEMGFGLFNIRERVDLLGGAVDVESTPGKGTTVTLKVPLIDRMKRREAAKKVPPEKSSRAAKKREKIRVLIVDDHKMLRDGLRKIVNEQEDLDVVAEASNGKEALNIAEETNPDIVVMDVNMPVMDGISATQYLKKRMPHVRVIALSFHDQQSVKDSMRNAGATAYLTKNEAFETLCATIRSEASAML